ncbi:glucoamylase family protein [Xanthomonas fragariae]|uniref:Glycoamylase-like domain-containing protein n=1 Tax=Xanthomonas fragariae TaxID=48664 RepID=A0ABY1RPE5_9XANT|nr:glucoamylase family protein [Xanthomonas fragariae]MDM7554760.1 glucoamylase family protein [Xanthomonas fragariae]MDM7557855.1 glucoamylase family protein [Xanthomonas fragariae]MDM7575541.1 glucoamylase family protein [Xanthomonas fragariae]MDM7578623.1 glucoamylase family protein [Xanthomonas fragariae]MDM7588828.1 glucoamylase family protein [Xanthomonas fragariae]
MDRGNTSRWLTIPLLLGALVLASCKQAEQPKVAEKKAPVNVILMEAQLPPKPVKPPLPPLFSDIERRTFQFFWDTANELNGLSPDRFPSRPFASIASVGFALTAYPIGIENGWVSRNQGIDRTLTTLRFFRDARMGPQRTGRAGYKGFYYHFLDMQQGNRYDSWVELSSVDTAMLMMGVLFTQSYYDGEDPREKEIRQIADMLYKRVDWRWLQQRAPLISMGWFPESGFIDHDWMGYNEAMMLYILALGSPTHGVDPDAWTSWSRTYNNDWGVYQGQEYLSFGPLFGHQYSHVWIDFRDIQDHYMREHGIDYFLNSRRATLAQRDYAIDNPMKWKDYGENVWGLTAGDGPQNTSQDYRGEQRQFRHYSSRGAGLRENFDDGTIVPSAAISSIVFAPEVVIPATEEMHKRYGDFLYSSYGFLDSFNPSFNYDIPLKTGRMVPDRGWVASDYIAIDQGPILAMISNYQNEFVWNVMKKNAYIRSGLERAGFTGGWLTHEGEPQPLPKKDEQAATARALGIAESRAAAAQAQHDPSQNLKPE